MLDSGAFSAWKRGEELSIQEYIKFIRDYQGLLHSYVSLDTIPGSMGRMSRSQAEIEKSAAASYKNQQIMKDAGLSPIPVFHQGERLEWLEKYLADGEPYIGISPYLRSSQGDIIEWLDQCFSIMTDSRGRPLVKTHGFGVTGVAIVARYPWFTVDSTTWAIAGGYGLIRIPDVAADGAFDFMQPGSILYTGYGSDKLLSLDNASDLVLERIVAFCELCGFSVTELHNNQYARTAAHVVFFRGLEEQKRSGRMLFSGRPASFLTKVAAREGGADVTGADFGFRIIYSTKIEQGYQGTMLSSYGRRSRLLSYHALRQRPQDKLPAHLEEYVTQGVLNGARSFLITTPNQNWDGEHYKDFRRRNLASRLGSYGEEFTDG